MVLENDDLEVSGTTCQHLFFTLRGPQGYIFGLLDILTCFECFPDKLISKPKLFVDEASLFPVAKEIGSSASNLKSDLAKKFGWMVQWKLNFSL